MTEEEVQTFIEGAYPFEKSSKLKNALGKISKQFPIHKSLIDRELICLQFNLRNGLANPKYERIDSSGTRIFGYPDMTLIDDIFFSYINKRIEHTPNPWLRARYAQILWNHPSFKHHRFLEIVVDTYIEIIPDMWKDADIKNITNLLSLAIITNHEKGNIISMLDENLFLGDQSWKFFDLMVFSRAFELRYFNTNQMEKALTKLDTLLLENWEKNDFSKAESVILLGEKIASKLNRDPKLWKQRLGKNNEKSGDSRVDDPTGLVPARFYADALKYYQKSKDKVGIERVKRKYSKIKNKIKLAEVDLPLDQEVLSEIQEINDQWIQGIVSRNPEEILNYLSSANDFMFLPNNKILDDIKASKIETFLDYINEIKIDINKNYSHSRR